MSGQMVYGVGVAEFDQKVGNSLSLQYPENIFKDFDVDSLANMCLPDGAHIHQEDWTYSILDRPLSSVASSQKNADQYMYAIAVFRNLVDPSLPRGAMQKAFLVLSYYPYFNLYEPLMKATLVRIMEGKDRGAPKFFYEEINSTYQKKQLQVRLWNDSFPLAYPVLEPDEFGGASARMLVKIFGVNTMYIWYSLLLEERLLFAGQPARTVGRCAFSAPLLVKPLTGFKPRIVPYVTLLDMGGALTRPTYICGTTNLLLEMRSELYDSLGNVSTASVVSQASGVKITGADKALIKSVIAGIEDGKGETWVREQFRRYTERFLQGLADNKIKFEQHRRLLSGVKDTELFRNYERRTREKAKQKEETFMDYLVKLRGATDDMRALDRPKLFYLLDKHLVDLPDIEEMIDNNGLDVVEDGLSADGAQVRKYAVNVLAKIAMNIKGQIQIVCGMKADFLSRVISMVKDPMPNVTIAACSCLVGISKLYIGADALLKHNVVELMAEIISEPNRTLTLKTQAVATLYQVYTYFPDTPRPAVDTFIKELQVKDEKYTGLLSQLLDFWEVDITTLVPVSDMRVQLEGLQVANLAHRAQATAYILSTLVAYGNKSIELAAADGVKVILANADAAEPDHELTRLSISVLTMIADTHTGSQAILRHKVVEWAMKKLKKTSSLVRTAYVLRFLIVCCQRPGTCLRFFCGGGMETVLSVLFRCVKNMDTLSLLTPCVDILKYSLMQLPHVVQASVEDAETILVQAPALHDVLQCCQDPVFQDAIRGLIKVADNVEALHPAVVEVETLIHEKREMRSLRLGLTEVSTHSSHSRRRETINLDSMEWTDNKLYVPKLAPETIVEE